MLLLTPQTPSPREFGLRLMELQNVFVRILEERGLSGWFFYSLDDRSFRVTESAVSNIFDLQTQTFSSFTERPELLFLPHGSMMKAPTWQAWCRRGRTS